MNTARTTKRILVILLFSVVMSLVLVQGVLAAVTYPYNFTYDGNPLARNTGASDPSVHVWDGTVWMYTSLDHAAGYPSMDGYHAFSSTDMVHWTDYGDVFNSSMLNDARWGSTPDHWMWAPGAARKQQNGVWTYYLYYPHNKSFTGETWVTGVATAPNPWGPFTDQGPLIGGTMGMDPMVFIDDDGQAYIYANSLKVARLNSDMVSLAETPRSINYAPSSVTNDSLLRFNEGSYMHKKDGVYYFSYSNFNNNVNQGFYSMGNNPYGPFTWKGAMAPHPTGAQDHHSIIDFNGQWYYFYHIAVGNYPVVRDGQSRIACFDNLYYNPDGTIQMVVETIGPKPTPTGPTFTPSPTGLSGTAFKVNSGGSAFNAGDGTAYSADMNYSGGGTYSTSAAISGTTDDTLYQSERNGNFSYAIPLVNGNYEVALKFAEIFHTSAGSRVFNVAIEGTQVLSNLDIWSMVGKDAAYDRTFTVNLTDGQLNIAFSTVVDNAKISAIRVMPVGTTATYTPTATKTHTPGTPTVTPTSYEAESGSNTLAGSAAVAACPTCSGVNKVGYVGGTTNSGTLQFNGVNATTAGNYTLTIHYLSGAARSAQLSVNDGSPVTLNFPSTGSWTGVGTLQTTVSLNGGDSNKIKLFNSTAYAPDFDLVTVNSSGPTPTPTATMTPTATSTVTPTATRTNTPTLSCEVTMTGLVYDAVGGTGQPIAGAHVGVDTSFPRTFWAVTGTDGRYSLFIPSGYCSVVNGIEVWADNYPSLTQAISISEILSQPIRDFALPPVTPTATRTNTTTPTRTPTPTTPPTSYEAEAGTLGGSAAVAACSTCSNLNKVGYVGGTTNSGTLQFNGVNATTAGNYTLTIYYLSGAARSAQLSVNGGSPVTLSFANLGNWTTVGTLQTTVSLNAGSNTIKLSNSSAYAPDFDRMTVNTGSGPTFTPTMTETNTPTPTKTNTPTPTPTTPTGPTLTYTPTPTPTKTNTPTASSSYEAESGVLGGSAKVVGCITCSGLNKVGYVGGTTTTGTLQFNNINAATAGNYTLTIYYLSGAARSAQLSVNGGSAVTLNFASTGNWDMVGTLQTTVSLNVGSNTLKFSNSTAYAPDFDRVTVQ